MAVSRYDQRKNYEEEEANAIGTEYVRADLLPTADAAKVRQLLEQYLDQRLLFYTIRNARQMEQVDSETAKLQTEMWSTVQGAATTRPTPPVALALSGMNDVLNTQGYTQAAWWNRLPVGAWSLMVLLAICCSLLIGYSAHRRVSLLFTVLPLVVAIAFFLIADIDSPRRGVIRVHPQNPISFAHSLHKQ
jgi:lipopolysaccharide export LptBFGC system permease protein LptF